MKRWLGAEWEAFSEALHRPAERGVRLHRVALTDLRPPSGPESVRCTLPAPDAIREELLDPIAWAEAGYYIRPDSPLGRLVYHDAGAYYLQEPSAMAAVAALAPQPGEWVLDLCAAPGGKSTAIGHALAGEGWLLANEIHPGRVEVLAENLERTGVPATVCQETPARLAQALGPCFDAVLVDAPCSGEGMFRKDPAAAAAWSEDAPARCAERQREILGHALRLVRPGGRLVYSTCTFNPLENEQIIAWAMANHPVAVRELPDWPGWSPGRPEWANGDPRLLHTRRLWPHLGRGEGHFVALLEVLDTPHGTQSDGSTGTRDRSEDRGVDGRTARRRAHRTPDRSRRVHDAEWTAWLSDLLAVNPPPAWRHPLWRGDLAFTAPPGPLPDGLRVLRPGLVLGRRRRDRFEPEHALAMALAPGAARRAVALDETTAARYLAGESLPGDGEKGVVWLHVAGLPLGWGRRAAGRINNLYPKGLRRPGVFV
ncbi:MAG: RsmF rRNA methyltransferase first C-terminal domain-containing protein [Alicyclobacillus sp.]|nr:RsmF rRNA methyltransferase first C-terminal domain-containing protein [Alicyclobacillus sp.]